MVPPVVVFQGTGNDVSLVRIDAITHAYKQGADTFGVELVSQYHDVFKGLLPRKFREQSSLGLVKGIRAWGHFIHLDIIVWEYSAKGCGGGLPFPFFPLA